MSGIAGGRLSFEFFNKVWYAFINFHVHVEMWWKIEFVTSERGITDVIGFGDRFRFAVGLYQEANAGPDLKTISSHRWSSRDGMGGSIFRTAG